MAQRLMKASMRAGSVTRAMIGWGGRSELPRNSQRHGGLQTGRLPKLRVRFLSGSRLPEDGAAPALMPGYQKSRGRRTVLGPLEPVSLVHAKDQAPPARLWSGRGHSALAQPSTADSGSARVPARFVNILATAAPNRKLIEPGDERFCLAIVNMPGLWPVGHRASSGRLFLADCAPYSEHDIR